MAEKEKIILTEEEWCICQLGNDSSKTYEDYLREVLSTIPEEKRYSLGSKGVEIINKLHRLEMEAD